MAMEATGQRREGGPGASGGLAALAYQLIAQTVQRSAPGGVGGGFGWLPPSRVEPIARGIISGAIPSTPGIQRDPACQGTFPGGVYQYSNAAKRLEDLIVGFATSVGIQCVVTSRVRDCDKQADLYRSGRTTAAPGTSQHEFGFAFDIVPRGGYSRYGATFADTVKWLVALSRYYGGDGLAEGDHAHLTVYDNDTWRAMLAARDVGFSIPWPSPRPRR